MEIIIAAILLVVVISTTMLMAYRSVVKNGKSYARQRGQNGDVFLDDACSAGYLKLTNQHTVRGISKSKGGGKIEEGDLC